MLNFIRQHKLRFSALAAAAALLAAIGAAGAVTPPGVSSPVLAVQPAHQTPASTSGPLPGVSTPVHTASTIVYFIEVAGNHHWCVADPSGRGAGTNLVLWGCQAQLWFGWTAAPIHYGTYANLGYFLLVNESNNLCARSSSGAAGANVFIDSCDWNNPNEVWGEYYHNSSSIYLESLNANGSNRELANNYGTLADGNPIVGWLPYSCAAQPQDELWTPVQGAQWFNAC